MLVRFSKKYGYEIEVAYQENGNIVRLMPEYVEVNYRYGVVDIHNGLTRTLVPLSRVIFVRATKVSQYRSSKSNNKQTGGGSNAPAQASGSN